MKHSLLRFLLMCRVSMQPVKRTRLDAMCDEEAGEEADEDDSQPSKRQRLEYEILAEHHQALNRNLKRQQQGEEHMYIASCTWKT